MERDQKGRDSVREQAAIFGTAVTRRDLPSGRRRLGNLDRVQSRSMAPDADQRGRDDGTWLRTALAISARYPGQSAVAGAGTAGALGLFVLWAIRTGIGG